MEGRKKRPWDEVAKLAISNFFRLKPRISLSPVWPNKTKYEKILDAADFANSETCSFTRFNDAFQRTLLKAGSLACENIILFRLALRRRGHFARRNVCDSAASLRSRR